MSRGSGPAGKNHQQDSHVSPGGVLSDAQPSSPLENWNGLGSVLRPLANQLVLLVSVRLDAPTCEPHLAAPTANH